MLRNKLKKKLDNNTGLQELLFKRGYLLTNKDFNIESDYPFYGNWSKTKINDYYLYVHKNQKYYIYIENNETYILIGHAYNPWDGISDEQKILEVLINSGNKSEEIFFEELSKITGVFALFRVCDKKILAVQDSVGIMPIFYMENANQVFLSSNSQLIADLCNLEMDKNIYKLINSKFYLIGIRHLPGIKSPFKEIKALTANTYLKLKGSKIIRFYPSKNYSILSEDEAIETISTVLINSMKLISEKFNASISLTGGTDSKMTLAAANGIYDRYKYFSFYSSEAEEKDAIAASEICKKMRLNHKIYEVPNNNESIRDFELIKSIINHNSGYVKKHNDAEIRKIAYLTLNSDIVIEVKSHVSEIGRGFYYEKHGLKTMPDPLKPRHMSNFYKRNMFDRKTLKYMDKAFEEFINVTKFGEHFLDRYDESDMFYWEHRMSQWAAFVKQDFDISHETTIIYNNRKLMDAFMNFDIQDRIEDIPQTNIIEKLNQELYNLKISNDNAMKDNKRILLERVFFEINSRF